MQLIAREREFIMSDLIIGTDKGSVEQFKLKKVSEDIYHIIRENYVVGVVEKEPNYNKNGMWIAADRSVRGKGVISYSKISAAKLYLETYFGVEFEDDGVK